MLITIGLALVLSGEPLKDEVRLTHKSPAWVNLALGHKLDGTQPHFPRTAALTHGFDPTVRFEEPPNLVTVQKELGAWLSREPPPTNKSWTKSPTGLSSWEPDDEVAVVYELKVDLPTHLVGSFGADNGLFIWVNGRYVFGAMAPGGAIADEYKDIDLGVIPAGPSYIEILLEDHGVATGFLMDVHSIQQ